MRRAVILALTSCCLAIYLLQDSKKVGQSPTVEALTSSADRSTSPSGQSLTEALAPPITLASQESIPESTRTAETEPKLDPSALESPINVPPRPTDPEVQVFKQMREDLASDDPTRQHAAAFALLGGALATILTFEGRPGDPAKGSMKPGSPEERVLGVNGRLYRFSATDYPALDALNAFYDRNKAGLQNGVPVPIPDEIKAQILQLADYALAIKQGR